MLAPRNERSLRHARPDQLSVYKQNGYQLAWSDGTRPRPTIDGLITAVRAADQDGLEPPTYHVDELDAASKRAGSGPSSTRKRAMTSRASKAR